MEYTINIQLFPIWDTILFWETILFYVLSLVSGFFYIKFFKELKKDKITGNYLGAIFTLGGIAIGGITSPLAVNVTELYLFGNIIACTLAIGLAVVLAFSGLDTPFVGCGLSISTGWFIGIVLMTGGLLWLPLLISILFLTIGILCGYVYERIKAKKIVTIE